MIEIVKGNADFAKVMADDSPIVPEPKHDYLNDPLLPPPGSWASVARFMAAEDDSGFDWDDWKDRMKDGMD